MEILNGLLVWYITGIVCMFMLLCLTFIMNAKFRSSILVDFALGKSAINEYKIFGLLIGIFTVISCLWPVISVYILVSKVKENAE